MSLIRSSWNLIRKRYRIAKIIWSCRKLILGNRSSSWSSCKTKLMNQMIFIIITGPRTFTEGIQRLWSKKRRCSKSWRHFNIQSIIITGNSWYQPTRTETVGISSRYSLDTGTLCFTLKKAARNFKTWSRGITLQLNYHPEYRTLNWGNRIMIFQLYMVWIWRVSRSCERCRCIRWRSKKERKRVLISLGSG